MHELLPWYANDTLGPEERVAFEEHLATCAECRAELELVEKMKLREAGPAALSDHPSPEQLLAVVRPEQADTELDADAARAIRQHLALCLTCADEAEWLTGEAVAAAAGESIGESIATTQRSILPWVGLVAALVVIAVLVPLILQDSSPTPGATTRAVVPSTQLSDSFYLIEVSPDSAQVILMFEIDIAPEDYPARLVLESGGREVDAAVIEDRDGLDKELFLVMRCDRTACPDGKYLARLTRARTGPAIEYPFRLETTAKTP